MFKYSQFANWFAPALSEEKTGKGKLYCDDDVYSNWVLMTEADMNSAEKWGLKILKLFPSIDGTNAE